MIVWTGAPRREPHRSVVRLWIAVRNERRSGSGVVPAALREALHLLVVFEDGVAPGRPERTPRHVERQILIALGQGHRLVIELQEPRQEVHLRRQVYRPTILMGEQLSGSGYEERRKRAHEYTCGRLLLLPTADSRSGDRCDASQERCPLH